MPDSPSAPFRPQTIGLSSQGRPLEVLHYGQSSRPLRILFLCGQHGDERAIRKAVRHFLSQQAPALAVDLPLLQVAVIPDANPDGSAARTRANALGLDLNRDHLRLDAPETIAIHAFVRAWRPHLIVDLHNYPARRKHLVDQRLRLGWDVCLDLPTHPAAACDPDRLPFTRLFSDLGSVAEQAGFLFGRYGLFCPDGSFRHGTPGLGDARNTLTLRYEVPTLLLEARNPSRTDSPADRNLLQSAVAASLREICCWAVREANFLLDFRLPANPGQRLPLGYRRRPLPGGSVPVRSLETHVLSDLLLLTDRRKIQPRKHRTLPAAYTLAKDDATTSELLHRQGLHLEYLPQHSCWRVPLDQTGGRLLALLLDPESPCRRQLFASHAGSQPNHPHGESCHD